MRHHPILTVHLMRQTFTRICVASAVLASSLAFGQSWTPSKPVRIVVPASGGTVDLVARAVIPGLQLALGQPVIADTKPGASGNIAATFVAKSPGDGQTILTGFNPIVISTFLSKNLHYDLQKDLKPITLGVTSEQILVVNSGLPVSTLAEFVALAKKSDGKMNFGSIGAGSASHLTMELFKSRAGIQIKHIPYKGAGPAMTDLLGKVTDAGVFAAANVIPYVKDGRLKALAVTGSKRLKTLPNVPSMAEAGFPNFNATIWIGFLAPAGTPDPVVLDMQQQFARVLTSPDVQKNMEANEFDVVASTPDEFARFLKREAETWGSVAKQAGLAAQ